MMKIVITTLLVALIANNVASECVKKETPLTGGQTIPTGDVEITNDGETIFVTVSTKEGWTVTEYHAKAVEQWDGEVSPGQFPVKKENIGAGSLTVEIPIASITGDIGCGAGQKKDVAIAFHAVTKRDGTNGGTQEETSWAEGTPFDGSRWGWYVSYSLDCDCEETPVLSEVPEVNRDVCCKECEEVKVAQTFKKRDGVTQVGIARDANGEAVACLCNACGTTGSEGAVKIPCEKETTIETVVRPNEKVKVSNKGKNKKQGIKGAKLLCSKEDGEGKPVPVEQLEKVGVACGNGKPGVLVLEVEGDKCKPATGTEVSDTNTQFIVFREQALHASDLGDKNSNMISEADGDPVVVIVLVVVTVVVLLGVCLGAIFFMYMRPEPAQPRVQMHARRPTYASRGSRHTLRASQFVSQTDSI